MGQKFNGKPGDLIQIFRGPYQHWAVYIGENEVVHLVREGGGKSSSSSESLSSSDGNEFHQSLINMLGHKQVNKLLDGMNQSRECNIIGMDGFAMMRGEDLNYDGPRSRSFLLELSSKTGKVKREKLADVVGNHRYQVNNLLDETYETHDPSIIVKEACAMVGSKLQYNVVTYNSKHFATEMRYGKAESRKFKGKPGDLIEIFRGPYQHWAVYIGKDEVVHLDTVGGGKSSSSSESLSSSDGNGFHQSLINMLGHKQVNKLLDGMNQSRECNIIGVDAIALISGEHRKYDVATLNNLLEVLISKIGIVKRGKLADVVGSDYYKVNNKLDKKYKPRDPSIIVKEACAMVGHERPYDVLEYNCEHFATEMRYGVAVSRQIQEALNKGMAVTFVVLVVLVTGARVVGVALAVVGAFAVCEALVNSRSSS